LSTELIVNEKITAKQVKLIVDDKMVGIVSIKEALNRARDRGLDLVVVADGEYPVCRILNVDRFRFERAKAEREQARRQRELTVETKEIQLRPVIGEADLLIKAKRAKNFLDGGDKVKVIVRFKGREKTHKSEGRRVIDHFLSVIGEHKIDKPLAEGDSELIIILASNVTKSDKRRLKEKNAPSQSQSSTQDQERETA